MNSPWGHVQHQEEVASGVLLVSTAGHGGFMLNAEAMKALNPALKLASVYGGRTGGYTCFEEDCEAVAVVYELQEAGIQTSLKPISKEEVVSYLGNFDTYKPYLKGRGLI
jgi:hypothetical protein